MFIVLNQVFYELAQLITIYYIHSFIELTHLKTMLDSTSNNDKS